MLVLSRRKNERILIGENISVQVVGVQGNTVRLGFEAPNEIKIVREELKERDEAAAKEAATE